MANVALVCFRIYFLSLSLALQTRTCVAKLAAFLGLVLDTFGRVPISTGRLRALSFQAPVTRKLLLFTRRVPFGTFSLMHLSHLCCHFLVIEVQVKDNAVDHVCLFLRPAYSIHV